MGIESDVVNADSRLAVKFHSRVVKNDFMSEKEGRPIFDDIDMITIMVPGDNTFTVDHEVREDHKARFPIQWAHYMNQKAGNPEELAGTPLSEWAFIAPAQVAELKYQKFFTVESIATASDSQIQGLGMKAGVSGFALRDRAKNYLKVAKDESASFEQDAMIKKLQEENASIKAETDAKLAAIQEQMAQLLAAANAKDEGAKRGPKPKNT